MPDLLDRLRGDQVAARKAADKDRTLLLGTVLAALKNRELEGAAPLTDAEVVDVLRKQIKQRRDSVEQYTAAGRDDLAGREQAELEALAAYLPPEADPAEIRAAADAAVAGGATDLGRLMGVLMAQFKGKADGSVVNRIAREALASQ
ncbi:MAG: GatB/YqeY domain-containing protein [Gemmatimonadetes bacterium]|nr:GatB/YqeY domain-containing protein [Gemmatimonadota bacterium]MCA9762139.1 GatB/YqeY domain-containing protein [Gemmatimonadota bacterium]MCB9517379.1 GatB/YqeY domain-containing protein [Gemmatimonadales bacterium]HPF62079.1 GatB/YqeY domain-containing protein [Gemmatimonadales bacterium]HRX17915.1 GatB/YqeY domain-containing protein [Gemmatimonadales bacterium]